VLAILHFEINYSASSRNKKEITRPGPAGIREERASWGFQGRPGLGNGYFSTTVLLKQRLGVRSERADHPQLPVNREICNNDSHFIKDLLQL